LGVASRRGADDLIFGGRVKVNGVTVTAPATKVNVNADVVMVDGKVIEGGVSFVKEHTYFMLNKPKGFVCSAKPNSSGGKTVLDLFEQWREEFTSQFPGKLPPRLFTVGRLDVATTGLLLVTTDGDWCQRVAHPSSEVVKQYIVTANNKPTRAQISEMAKGTDVDGAHVVPVRVETMGGDGGPKNRILVEVVDGRNREVRVLCSNAGVDVKNLKRTRIGGLRMPKELPLGKYVRLQPHQVAHVLDKGLARNGGTF
jgi:pseudouridine synthase|tara:strand:- start:401 stop:1165 length:765 start_codon:yes stop_codon:yes gene_type:complete